MLTAYHTGLRVSEVFELTWNDIDLENKKLTVNKNVLKKKLIQYLFFWTCKTSSGYRTIDIGTTLVNALKEYKAG